MPIVPFDKSARKPATLPKPDDPWLLMAAAQMDAQGRLVHSFPSAQDMSDDEYDSSWVRSHARRGRSDEEMRKLEPDLEPYQLSPDSDLVSYHKKRAPKLGDLTS